MPGQYQITLQNLPTEIKTLQQLGVKAVLLFGIPNKKDLTGSDAYNVAGIIQTAIKIIKDITEYIRQYRFQSNNDETFWDLLVEKFPQVETELSFQTRSAIDKELYGGGNRSLNRTAYGFPSDGSFVLLFGTDPATAIDCGFFTFNHKVNNE